MPEIAEVRVVAKTLRKCLIGKKILDVKVYFPKMIKGDISSLKNKTITKINTKGKWLIFECEDKTMLSHLRMEGKYFYVKKGSPIEHHTHVVFSLDDDYELRYNDVRKFGVMEIINTKDLATNTSLLKLGKEPSDKTLTPDYLKLKLSKKTITIKEALMDQGIIAGIGNIYANEVLFAARINPFRPANSITLEEAKKIIYYAKTITEESEKLGGCTIRSYTSSLGVKGHYQEKLKCHMREGKPCLVCGEKIIRDYSLGRSTYYCKRCQK